MTEDPIEPGERTFGRRPVAAFAVLLVALLALGVVLARDLRQADAEEDSRQQAIDTASEAVLYLTSIDGKNATDNLEKLLAISAPGTSFRENLSRLAGTFQKTVDAGQVTSRGEVTSGGVVSLDDDSAEVVIAASATVSNIGAPDGEPRNYRMTVVLERDGDDWLVQNMEFVE